MIKKVVTITGASGVGKTTLERALETHYGGGRVRSITTRPRRPYETDVDYDFQTLEGLRDITEFIWKVLNHGHQYCCTESQFAEAAAETGGLAFVCIIPECHQLVSDWFQGRGVRCIPVHLVAPGVDELTRRLRSRGETDETIVRRLADSMVFDQVAGQIPQLNLVPAGSKKEVFNNVVRLIETTP